MIEAGASREGTQCCRQGARPRVQGTQGRSRCCRQGRVCAHRQAARSRQGRPRQAERICKVSRSISSAIASIVVSRKPTPLDQRDMDQRKLEAQREADRLAPGAEDVAGTDFAVNAGLSPAVAKILEEQAKAQGVDKNAQMDPDAADGRAGQSCRRWRSARTGTCDVPGGHDGRCRRGGWRWRQGRSGRRCSPGRGDRRVPEMHAR